MITRRYITLLFYLLMMLNFTVQAVSLKFDSKYSTLKINANATFNINSTITGFNGTLVKATGANITGSDISFVDGLFEDAGNQILLSALYNPSGIIRLLGNSTFNAQPGIILQSVVVSGGNNRLVGQPIFSSDISFVDSLTTLTIGIQSQMNKNIQLNGGTLVLLNDLVFADDAFIIGNGTIHGNKYSVTTGGKPFTWASNINWFTNINLSANTDFSGSFTFNATTNNIRGDGYVYNLTAGSVITVASGATLTLDDVVIKGLGNSASCGKIILTDSTSKLALTNATIILCDDFTTSNGLVEAQGPTTVVVQNHTWNFSSTGTLKVDSITLWKDVAGASPCGDITFASGANQWLINNGTIDY